MRDTGNEVVKLLGFLLYLISVVKVHVIYGLTESSSKLVFNKSPAYAFFFRRFFNQVILGTLNNADIWKCFYFNRHFGYVTADIGNVCLTS